MGWAAPIAALGTQIGGPIAQGIFGSEAADAQKAQYEFNAKSELIAADQDAASRLSDLNSTMSSINAIRTSRGLDVASPTGMAIASGITKKTDANILASQLNYGTRAQSDMFGAYNANVQGQAALLGGFLKGGQNIADMGETQGWF